MFALIINNSSGATTFFNIVASLLFLLALLIVIFVLRRHHLKGATIKFDVIGKRGRVHTALAPQGSVLIGGELWLARTVDGSHLPAHKPVRAVKATGHILIVEPLDE